MISFCTMFISCGLFGDKTPPDKKTVKKESQANLKKELDITLRAANTAFNAKRYDLAEERFEYAVQKGYLDGVFLYKYAETLEQLNKKNESKIFYQKALDELLEFSPDSVYIEKLKSKGYRKSK